MSFTWTFWLLKISVKRLHTLVCFLCFESFSFHLEITLFGEIVVNYPFGKTLNSIDLVNLMSSVSVRFNSFLFLYSIFNEHKSDSTSFRLEFVLSFPSGFDLQLFAVRPRSLGLGTAEWSVWMDSNHRPHAYQACALTTWATNRLLSLIWYWFFHLCQHVPTGGDDGVRTHDPLLAGQVLSQLSYTPVSGLLFQGSFWSLKIEQQKFRTRFA